MGGTVDHRQNGGKDLGNGSDVWHDSCQSDISQPPEVAGRLIKVSAVTDGGGISLWILPRASSSCCRHLVGRTYVCLPPLNGCTEHPHARPAPQPGSWSDQTIHGIVTPSLRRRCWRPRLSHPHHHEPEANPGRRAFTSQGTPSWHLVPSNNGQPSRPSCLTLHLSLTAVESGG